MQQTSLLEAELPDVCDEMTNLTLFLTDLPTAYETPETIRNAWMLGKESPYDGFVRSKRTMLVLLP